MTEHVWTVDDHLRAAPASSVELYRAVEEILLSQGDVRLSVSRTTITFKGRRRGFAGARPTSTGVVGYLDLMRRLDPDPRLGRASPYTKRLWVHQYRVSSPEDLDATFTGWIAEAFRVGEGDHLLR